MFAANPTFARVGSHISLDMLKSMRKVPRKLGFSPRPKTLNALDLTYLLTCPLCNPFFKTQEPTKNEHPKTLKT